MAVEFPTLEGWDAPDEPALPDARWRDMAAGLLRPYLEAYRIVIGVMLDWLPEDAAPDRIQREVEARCDPHHPAAHLCLCRDVISNCRAALLRLGAGTGAARPDAARAALWSRERLLEVAAALDTLPPAAGAGPAAKL
ncbi:uncharacterized protein LOC119111727 [Pollicipes pollicipes]|uniref:uncharacterized protein LOC119111727 n=1 Tax=Pollicipes pollicipes TaxID=41117 RepID=UPI0018850AFA|nr:uncharacterized protein LOC119111727 [Pollicipes pollicipes]